MAVLVRRWLVGHAFVHVSIRKALLHTQNDFGTKQLFSKCNFKTMHKVAAESRRNLPLRRKFAAARPRRQFPLKSRNPQSPLELKTNLSVGLQRRRSVPKLTARPRELLPLLKTFPNCPSKVKNRLCPRCQVQAEVTMCSLPSTDHLSQRDRTPPHRRGRLRQPAIHRAEAGLRR
jgi:hypothetical protein